MCVDARAYIILRRVHIPLRWFCQIAVHINLIVLKTAKTPHLKLELAQTSDLQLTFINSGSRNIKWRNSTILTLFLVSKLNMLEYLYVHFYKNAMKRLQKGI